MLGQHPHLAVDAAARRQAGDDRQGLAGIEIGTLGVRAARRRENYKPKPDDGSKPPHCCSAL
jgi:hypothetical protein